MTEKRFSWDNVNIAIKDNQNRKKYFIDITCIDEIVDLLNELHEENQELKRIIKKMGELGGFNKHMIKTICGDFE